MTMMKLEKLDRYIMMMLPLTGICLRTIFFKLTNYFTEVQLCPLYRLLDREQIGNEEAAMDDEEEDGFLKAFKV